MVLLPGTLALFCSHQEPVTTNLVEKHDPGLMVALMEGSGSTEGQDQPMPIFLSRLRFKSPYIPLRGNSTVV